MLRRIFTIACLVAAASATTTSVFASSHVILQRTTPRGEVSMYVIRGLLPAHKYRIDIVAQRHDKFSALGFENYNGIYNKHFFEGTKPLKFSGKTPYSFSLSQPVKQSLSGWSVAVQVSNAKRKTLTVRIVDLGKSK